MLKTLKKILVKEVVKELDKKPDNKPVPLAKRTSGDPVMDWEPFTVESISHQRDGVIAIGLWSRRKDHRKSTYFSFNITEEKLHLFAIGRRYNLTLTPTEE